MSEPEASDAGAVRTPLTELLGIRYPVVQAAMGYVSGPRLAAAVSDAGGLGLIASATMSLAELEKAIEETAGRTAGPFGVNLRADAPDATERVRLIVTRRVPVASFAQAPKPELIAALKDAGVVTIASVGARRHAEKAAGWGIDAVIATGGEGGGHVGAVPTSLLVPQVAAAVGHPGDRGRRVLRRPRPDRRAGLGRGRDRDGHPVPADQRQPGGRRGQAALPGGGPGRHGGHHGGWTGCRTAYCARRWSTSLRGAGGRRGAARRGVLSGPRRAGVLVRSARNAAAFRGVSGMGWGEMLRQGREMQRGSGLSWEQVLMAANTPVLLRAAMVDGRTDLGLMSSGQVTGLIDDLPSCAELIEAIMAEAGATLDRLRRAR